MCSGGSGLPARSSDRGQSISINFTLSLVIVTLLMSGLFMSVSGFLDTERERVTRSEFEVLGNRIAADISTVDRLAQTTDGDAEVRVTTKIPARVGGTDYEVTITSSQFASTGYYDVEVQFRAPEVGVSRNVSTRTDFAVVGSKLIGGRYTVVYDGTDIEVNDA